MPRMDEVAQFPLGAWTYYQAWWASSATISQPVKATYRWYSC